MANFGITLNCIEPGQFKTNLLRGISDEQIEKIVSQQIIKRTMSENDVSKMVDLLLSDSSANITGQVLHLGGV